MIGRIIPLLGVLAVIGLFAFVIVAKKRKVLFLEWSRKTSIILATLVLVFYVSYMIYYAIGKGVYLYLLHTDICTMLYPWVTISLILNARKILRILYPLSITGGFLELATSKMTFTEEHAFDEVSSFVRHTTLVVISIYIMINEVDYKWKYFGFTVIWFFSFIAYVLLVLGIPYAVTGDKKFGSFSMALMPSAFEEVNVSWTGTVISGSYVVLKWWGHPFGTIGLIIVAFIVGSSAALTGVITSKYKVEKIIKTDYLWTKELYLVH